MSVIIGHKCLHCGKEKGRHRALTYACPIPLNSRSFPHFSPTDVYEPNPKKPVTVPFVL